MKNILLNEDNKWLLIQDKLNKIYQQPKNIQFIPVYVVIITANDYSNNMKLQPYIRDQVGRMNSAFVLERELGLEFW